MNLMELSIWFCFSPQLPTPSLLTLKEVTWTWWCFLLCKCLVYHLWQSQEGRKVCVSERRQITALTMLHIDSHNCRTSIIILRNMPRQGEAPRESRAPPDTALWHMVFTALFTHNREHFGQALKLSEGLLCNKELVPTNMWNSQGPSSHSNIRIHLGGGSLPPPFLHTQLMNGENVSFGIITKQV